MEADKSTVWPRLRNFIAGYFSGMALVLTGHPFDTVKVRLQTEGRSGRFNGPIHCLMQTLKLEGVRGLYKGVTPPLFATGVINSVLFGLQGLTTNYIKADPTRPATVSEVALSAVITGAMISILVTPMEGIKARLQIQYKNKEKGIQSADMYKGPLDCTKKVVRQLGIFNGLYRGWVPTALCRMSNWAYFGAYEFFKGVLAPAGDGPKKLSLGSSVLAGGLAGGCYWLSCYPIDVIKNRIQAAPDVNPPKYRGMIHAAKVIYQTDGWRAFFAGFTPCLMRAFPANAACFVAFELVMHILPE